jgi:hypothetical protein
MELPLNNNNSFTNNYLTYVNVYELNKTTYATGFPFTLDENGEGIKGQIDNNTIIFSPSVINNDNSYWFNLIGGKYFPQKWLDSVLYQQKETDLVNIFTFKGNINTNTLQTAYGDNYTYQAFICAFDAGYNQLGLISSQTNVNGNFSITLDTTRLSTIKHLQWGFKMRGYPVYPSERGNQGSIQITNYENIPCFKEDSKILTNNGYIPIQNLKKGDLVKTLKHGYLAINMIGVREIINQVCEERIKDKLYICSQIEYPEVFEDLFITGCHAILVDEFKEGQHEMTNKVLGNIFITDNKYRLPACVDERTKPYQEDGTFKIYHIALDNDNYYTNYGIYANGLLVETCSKRYLKELSNMKLIE